MTTVTSPLSEQAREAVGKALQGALVDLLDLSLQAKQAHWNVVGKNFRSVHLQLDEVVTLARSYADDLAERASALGVSPDGRAKTIADTVQSPQLDSGYLGDELVVSAIVELLASNVERFRQRVTDTEESDPITQDLLIDVTQDLEKQHWMFQASQR